MENTSFGIIGGDVRFLYLADFLQKKGYSSSVFIPGFEISANQEFPNLTFCTSLSEVLQKDAVVLPLPVTRDSVHLSCPLTKENLSLKEIFQAAARSSKFFVGGSSRYLVNLARDAGVQLQDYYTSETLLYKNALLTAEGTLYEMIGSMGKSLSDSFVTIFGYGRIASLLTRRLISLGSSVNVVCRNEGARASAETDGAQSFSFEECIPLASISDCVINTVPAQVIHYEFLSAMKFHAPLIDLASSPGEKEEEAKACDVLLKHAPGLPGKYFPKSAAEAIMNAILSMIP